MQVTLLHQWTVFVPFVSFVVWCVAPDPPETQSAHSRPTLDAHMRQCQDLVCRSTTRPRKPSLRRAQGTPRAAPRTGGNRGLQAWRGPMRVAPIVAGPQDALASTTRQRAERVASAVRTHPSGRSGAARALLVRERRAPLGAARAPLRASETDRDDSCGRTASVRSNKQEGLKKESW